jgi:hypothetical protein
MLVLWRDVACRDTVTLHVGCRYAGLPILATIAGDPKRGLPIAVHRRSITLPT